LLALNRAGKAHRRYLASYITGRCNEFQSLTPAEAWAKLPKHKTEKAEPRLTLRRAAWLSVTARSPTSPLDERTIRAVRTFVEESAPGKAVNILLSEGCHDPKDPTVVHKIQPFTHPHRKRPKVRVPTSRHLNINGMTWKAAENGSGSLTG
jgi:hypothetical protein